MVFPLVQWEVSELDGSHTGEMVLYWGLEEQARHEHMSEEYKGRYNIIALLKTPPWYTTDNARTSQWFPPD